MCASSPAPATGRAPDQPNEGSSAYIATHPMPPCPSRCRRRPALPPRPSTRSRSRRSRRTGSTGQCRAPGQLQRRRATSGPSIASKAAREESAVSSTSAARSPQRIRPPVRRYVGHDPLSGGADRRLSCWGRRSNLAGLVRPACTYVPSPDRIGETQEVACPTRHSRTCCTREPGVPA